MVDLAVGLFVVFRGVHQVLVQGLAVDRHTLGARRGDRGDAGCRRGVHHVERRALDIGGQPDDPVERQVLGQCVVHLGHVLEAGPVLAKQLLVHVHDDVVVLGVDRRDAAGLCQDLQHLPDVAEIDHAALAAGGDVGREDLDRGVPRLDRFLELRQDLGCDLALHHRVKRVVAIAGAGPFLLPSLDRALDAVAGLDEREVDHRRGTAEKGGAADHRGRVGQLMLGRARHDNRPAAMHMRVDAAGDDDLPCGIDDPAGTDRGKAARRADRGDFFAGDADVGRMRARRKDGETARDDDVEHMKPPNDGEAPP